MNAHWDKDKGGRDEWIKWMGAVAAECLRVIKPGGHALVWALPRTSHWTGMGWENGGWEPRDKMVHLFGTGFPKSLDISKAIDKAAGEERRIIGKSPSSANRKVGIGYGNGEAPDVRNLTEAATEQAKQWEGWGTGLKPAHEDWWLFRKPISGKTIAGNVLEHGTGAINIDGCRVGTPFGRYPTNLVHDGSNEVIDLFPVDTALYFYCPKASVKDRDEGLTHLRPITTDDGRDTPIDNPYLRGKTLRYNHHPTVKNTDLMRYLCRLITPPGGVVLDPFCGSGSTGKGAILEDFRFIGIEREADYVSLAEARISSAAGSPSPLPVTAESPANQDSIPTGQLSLF